MPAPPPARFNGGTHLTFTKSDEESSSSEDGLGTITAADLHTRRLEQAATTKIQNAVTEKTTEAADEEHAEDVRETARKEANLTLTPEVPPEEKGKELAESEAEQFANSSREEDTKALELTEGTDAKQQALRTWPTEEVCCFQKELKRISEATRANEDAHISKSELLGLAGQLPATLLLHYPAAIDAVTDLRLQGLETLSAGAAAAFLSCLAEVCEDLAAMHEG